jgi:transposase
MRGLNKRLDRISGPKRCPVCKQPNPPLEDIEVRTDVHTLTEEEVQAIRDGTYVEPLPREPERCPECGRPTEVIISMKGLPDKSRGDGRGG